MREAHEKLRESLESGAAGRKERRPGSVGEAQPDTTVPRETLERLNRELLQFRTASPCTRSSSVSWSAGTRRSARKAASTGRKQRRSLLPAWPSRASRFG